mgnify:CR=1 FL=1
MQCSICGLSLEANSDNGVEWNRHNAQPINDGTCCTDCNDNVVTPRRLKDMGYTVVPFPFKSEGRIA